MVKVIESTVFLPTHRLFDPRFLEDVAITAKLSGGDHLKAGLLPSVLHLALPLGFLVTRGLQNKARRQRTESAADLVDVWNQVAFLFFSSGSSTERPPAVLL